MFRLYANVGSICITRCIWSEPSTGSNELKIYNFLGAAEEEEEECGAGEEDPSKMKFLFFHYPPSN